MVPKMRKNERGRWVVTKNWLRETGACSSQRRLFAEWWPRGMAVTRGNLRQSALRGLQVEWLGWRLFGIAGLTPDASWNVKTAALINGAWFNRTLTRAYQVAVAKLISDMLGLPRRER